MTLKHKKKRNVGLVYELLTREIADAVIAEDTSRATRALEMVEKHLGRGPLNEELAVHHSVVNARGASERLARSVVDQLKAASVRFSVDKAKRDRLKTQMIHDLNRSFGDRLFERRIPDYQVHASIGIMIERGLGLVTEGVDAARIEDAVVSYLTTTDETRSGYDPDANAFAYNKAVELYQEEYGREMSKSQLELMREYVRVDLGGPEQQFRRVAERQRAALIEQLSSARHDEVFRDDKDMAKSLNEGLDALKKLTFDDRDSAVESLMAYHQLAEEINR